MSNGLAYDTHFKTYASTSDEVWRPESALCDNCQQPWPCDVFLLGQERGHAQEVAELAEKDRRTAWFDAKRALTERDRLRAQVAAVRALADEWQRELDSGAIRDEKARYCWSTAARELRAAFDTVGGSSS